MTFKATPHSRGYISFFGFQLVQEGTISCTSVGCILFFAFFHLIKKESEGGPQNTVDASTRTRWGGVLAVLGRFGATPIGVAQTWLALRRSLWPLVCVSPVSCWRFALFCAVTNFTQHLEVRGLREEIGLILSFFVWSPRHPSAFATFGVDGLYFVEYGFQSNFVLYSHPLPCAVGDDDLISIRGDASSPSIEIDNRAESGLCSHKDCT